MELISVEKPYNGMEAKLGDVVYVRWGLNSPPEPPRKVVYVGEVEFVTESPAGRLITYRKDTAGRHLDQAERRLLVNGFAVPVPLEKDPGDDQVVYVADPTLPDWHCMLTQAAVTYKLLLSRGLAHDTAAAAIAHAKAMAGVDPTTPVPLDDDNLP